MDPYQVLGVAPGAAQSEVRKAYLRLARAHHPDGHAAAGPAAVARAERRMQQVNEAWAILGDAARRERYDDERSDPSATRATPVRPPSGKGWTPRADDTGWMDDFDAWRYDDDDFVPPDAPRTLPRQLLTTMPIALFALSVGIGCLGLVMELRPLLAVAFGGVVSSAVLFLGVTLLELRGRTTR